MSLDSAVRKTRPFVVGSVLLVAAILAALAFERFVLGMRPDNRFHLYAIHRTLRPGMPRGEVLHVLDLARERLHRNHTSADRRYVTVSVGVGLQSECDLRLEFAGESLLHAKIRDADNGLRPEDAPSDF